MGPAADPRTVLVVDDDPGLQTLIRKRLEREGLRTAAALSGADAIAWLRAKRADLMLLDLILPDMAGEDLVRHLAEIGADVPFVVITGHGGERAAVDIMKQGARDYLMKDAAFAELLPSVVWQAIEQVERERRLAAAEEELRRTNVELQQKNAELEQFIYTASHDLKSPLVTIVGYTGHIGRDLREGRTDRLAEFAERIEVAAARMRELIDHLLELGRIGRLVKPVEPVDVADLVRSLLKDHAAEIAAGRIQVAVDEAMPTIIADRARVAQVFDNLLVNAIVHGVCADAPRIEIGAKDGVAEAGFYVRDNGPGISRQHHARIFEIFQRLDPESKGSGIGLSVVKRIVEVHGGRVWVESDTGQGATFWVSFPKNAAAGADRPST
jgi:signal transduction histidine kinase